MEIPSTEPDPETRGPMISLLNQWYTNLGLSEAGVRPTVSDDVDCPDTIAAVIDLQLMFTGYVLEHLSQGHEEAGLGAVICFARMFAYFARETEKRRPGDFREFLHRQAAEPFLPQDPDEGA